MAHISTHTKKTVFKIRKFPKLLCFFHSGRCANTLTVSPPPPTKRNIKIHCRLLKPQNFTDVIGLWISLGCILAHLCLIKSFKVFEAPSQSQSKDPHVKNTVNNVTFPCQDNQDICGLGPYYLREQYNYHNSEARLRSCPFLVKVCF